MNKKVNYKQLVLSSLLSVSLLGAYATNVEATETTTVADATSVETPATAVANETTSDASVVEKTAPDAVAPTEEASVASEATSESVVAETPVEGAISAEATVEAVAVSEDATATTEAPVVEETAMAETMTVAVAETPTVEIGQDAVVLSEEKPEVATPEVLTNTPDRVSANVTENPDSEMAFTWYTVDAVSGAEVQVSKTEDFAETIDFAAEQTAVTSSFQEKTADGELIYAVDLDNGDGTTTTYYYTDVQISADNTEWTGGEDVVGENAAREYTEFFNKAVATGLEANTKYFYRVGQVDTGFSPVGQFTTAGTGDDPFTFVHYTDTQNYWNNENVRNEAEYGAQTLREALAKAEETSGGADFAIRTGDVVEHSDVEDEWADMINQL